MFYTPLIIYSGHLKHIRLSEKVWNDFGWAVGVVYAPTANETRFIHLFNVWGSMKMMSLIEFLNINASNISLRSNDDNLIRLA